MLHKFRLFLLFTLAFLGLFFAMGMQDYMFMRPQSIHQWRQTVCLNIALNFAEQENSLLQPETNLLNADNQTNGIAQGEFPIYYYIIGKIWKITGQQEWIYRLSTLLLFFTALYAIADFIFRETKNLWSAVLVPLFFFVLPVLAYYSVSFLMDGVALSLLILGWYSFYRFQLKDGIKWIVAMFLFFTLTGLLKVTLLISVIALLSFSIAAWLIPGLVFRRKYFWAAPVSLAIIFTIVLNVAWYAFAIDYNNVHHGWVTENGIYPIWELTQERWHTIVDWVLSYWATQYAPPFFYIFFLLILVFLFIQKPKLKKFIFFYWTVGLTLLGSIMYILLWIQVFHEHDYYIIAIYPFFIGVVLFGYFILWEKLTNIGRKVALLFMTIFVVWGGLFSREQLQFRLTGWPNNDGNNTFSSYFDLEPFLRNEIGIDRYEKVVAYPDYSVCISLYLCDQKGWQMSPENNADFLKSRVELGAKYILVNESSFYSIEGIDQFQLKKVGQHKKITVLKIE